MCSNSYFIHSIRQLRPATTANVRHVKKLWHVPAKIAVQRTVVVGLHGQIQVGGYKNRQVALKNTQPLK
jgi:hypothetical protein